VTLTSRRLALRVAGASLAVWAALLLIVVLVKLDGNYGGGGSLASGLPDVLLVLAFVVVGSLVSVKRPENLVGWTLAIAGLALLVGDALGAYGELSLRAKPELGLPGGAAAGAFGSGSWTPLMAGIFMLLVLFPRGEFPSERWRVLARFVLLGFALTWVMIATAPGKLDPPLDAYENPLAVTHARIYVIAVFPVIAFCLVCTGLAGIHLVLRFRRSHGQERQQFKWFAASATSFVLMLPFATVFNYSGVTGALFGIALLALPLSVGIAVLRYRLYEIDRIIRRTLVYGVLSGILAASYFGIVLALQQVFSSVAGGSDLAIAGSTLAVAALARPARRRVQELVDRRFYRGKYDAERTLAAFATRLRDEVDLDTLRSELTAVVADTMQPASVSLWLRESAR
jgi:hypothetical protein